MSARNEADPYVDPQSGIMKNKLGITDEKALQAAERDFTRARIAELSANPVKGKFDLEHIKDVHGRIFQDLYPWAGQTRSVDIEKGTTKFAPVMHMEGYANGVFAKLNKENNLKGLSDEKFVDRAAFFYSEINSTHLFREGNGRTQRAFMEQLGKEAGRTLDFSRIPAEQMVRASEASHNFGHEHAKPLIVAALAAGKQLDQERQPSPAPGQQQQSQSERPQPNPRAAEAFAKLDQKDALKQFPELAPAYSARDELRQVAAEFQPASGAVARSVSKQIDATIANQIKHGAPTVASDKLQDAVRLEVSRKSLDFASQERVMYPERSPNITERQRETLVKASEAEMQKPSAQEYRRAGAHASQGTFDAYSTARTLAQLDYPKSGQPFTNSKLAQAYQSEQNHSRYAEQRQASEQAQAQQQRSAAKMDMGR